MMNLALIVNSALAAIVTRVLFELHDAFLRSRRAREEPRCTCSA